MADVARILIVGGGIAGLSAATALHRQGFTPELVERSPVWPAVGAGIFLPANGVRMLAALGVGDAVEQTAAVVRRWAFFDQQGEPLCATDLEDLWRDVGPCWGVTRIRLQEALRRGAAVPHRLDVALTALTQDDHRVSVDFSDGTSGDYDLVIGADGTHSTVRSFVVAGASISPVGQTVWRSLIPARPRGLVDFAVLLGEGCLFGVVPMGEGRTYGFGLVKGKHAGDRLEGRLDRFRRRFADFGGPVPEYLAALERDEQLHVGSLVWVDLDQWYRGRVVLIGDAAHAGPPTMGEGGCMAMEDAVVLADVLRAADRIDNAFKAYVQRRRPRSDWVQGQSRVGAQAMMLPPAVRDVPMRERGDQMLRDRFQPLIPVP